MTSIHTSERHPTSTKSTPPTIEEREQQLTVSFYQEEDPETLWIRLRGAGVKRSGFTPESPVRVRVMQGCLMVTAD